MAGALLSPASAVAQEDERPLLRVAYTEFPPIEYRNAKGEADGLVMDLTRKVAAEAGYQPEFIYLPVGRIYLYLKNGTVDVWPGLTGIPSLREDVLESWVSPVPVQLNAWYVEGTPPLSHFDGLRGRTVIVISGYTYGGLLGKLEATGDIRITEAPNHRSGIDMLKRERGDYLLDYQRPVEEILRHPSDRLIRYSKVRTRNSAWLFSLASPRASTLRDEFDDAYLRLAERGEVPPVRELDKGFFIPGFPEDLQP
ncbi:MAG: substrate-binding periplasmic protein [Pseudomonadota bacterium]